MKDLKPRKRDSFHLTAIFSSFPWCLNRQISFKSKRLRVMPMLCPWKAWGHCICEEVSFGGQETWFRNHGHTRDTSDTVFVPRKCTCWTPVPHCDYAWRWSLYRELQGGSLGWDWPLLRPSKKRRRHHCVCPEGRHSKIHTLGTNSGTTCPTDALIPNFTLQHVEK